MESIIFSLIDSIEMGADTGIYESEIISNIVEYANCKAFYRLPMEIAIKLLSQTNTLIPFETAQNILSNYTKTKGKDALDILKVLRTEHLSNQQSIALITIIDNCPIIEELRSTLPNNSASNNEGNDNPFMSLVGDNLEFPDDNDDPSDFMTIFEAARKGNLDIVKKLVEQDEHNISTRDRQVPFLFLLLISYYT